MKFLKNIAAFSVVDLAAIALGVITAPITTRLLTMEQYGAVPLLSAVWVVVTILQFAGMESAFILFRAKGEHDPRKITTTTTIVASAVAPSVWLVFALLAFSTPWLAAYAGVSMLELAGFLLWVLANSLLAWQLHLLRFTHQAMRFAKVSLIGRVASIPVALPVMYFASPEYRLAAGLFTYTVFAWISVAIGASEVRKSAGNPYERRYFDRSLVRPMLRVGTSLIPGAAIYSLFSVTDRLLLGWFATPADVAVFALAASVAGAALVIKLGFARAWDPLMVEWIATRDETAYMPRLQATLELVGLFVPILTLLALAWAEPVFALLFPPAYAGSATVMPVLVLAGTLSTLALVTIATEVISGRTRYRLPVYVIGLLANALFCVVFIPRFGAVAAAYGALVGELVIVLLWAVVGHWIVGNLKLNWLRPGIALGVAGALCAGYRPGVLLSPPLLEALIVTTASLALGWLIASRGRNVFSHLPLPASQKAS